MSLTNDPGDPIIRFIYLLTSMTIEAVNLFDAFPALSCPGDDASLTISSQRLLGKRKQRGSGRVAAFISEPVGIVPSRIGVSALPLDNQRQVLNLRKGIMKKWGVIGYH
jgi:hypothetical protein